MTIFYVFLCLCIALTSQTLQLYRLHSCTDFTIVQFSIILIELIIILHYINRTYRFRSVPVWKKKAIKRTAHQTATKNRTSHLKFVDADHRSIVFSKWIRLLKKTSLNSNAINHIVSKSNEIFSTTAEHSIKTSSTTSFYSYLFIN